MVTTVENIWDTVVVSLKNSLSTPGFETFLSTAKAISFDDGVLVLGVPNIISQEWIHQRCEKVIVEQLRQQLHQSIMLDVVINPDLQSQPTYTQEKVGHNIETNDVPAIPTPAPLPKKNSYESNLNTKYTFDAFVIGNSNRFAHAASIAVSQSPARAYNPLFIYGGVGLGKTHLMHAIGHKALERYPNIRVMYVTSERFTNELINSIREDRTEEFRNRYRNIDILLIDDIQFIAGKERTQEEFFHTFNALHENEKQIIISSDRPPREIPTLEERLRSRFEWGLSVDIQIPDYETRMAILRNRIRDENLEVSDDVLSFIASQIHSNIRELEGALIRIVAYSSLTQLQLDPELARTIIKDIVKPKREKPITINMIKKVTAQYFDIPVDDLSAKSRTKELAHARQLAMYLSREMTKSSLPKIGESFGNRDHTTVMHACDRIKEGIKESSELKETVETIINNINNMEE